MNLNIFYIYLDRKKTFFVHFLFIGLLSFIIPIFLFPPVQKLFEQKRFLELNNIKSVVVSNKCFFEEPSYILATPRIKINTSEYDEELFVTNCEVFMQNRCSHAFEDILGSKKIMISRSLADRYKLSVGDSLYIQMMFNHELTEFKISSVASNELRVASDVVARDCFAVLPYIKEFEEFLKNDYIIYSQKPFYDLPNDIRVNAINKFSYSDFQLYFVKRISFFLCFFCLLTIIAYLILKNILQEDFFSRIYDLFNFGLSKSSMFYFQIKVWNVLFLIPGLFGFALYGIMFKSKIISLPAVMLFLFVYVFLYIACLFVTVKKCLRQGGSRIL